MPDLDLHRHSRKRYPWLLVFALLLLVALLLFLRPGRDQSLRRVQEAGVLVVALDASYPPFETTDGQGNFGGFDVDLAHEIARRLGVRAEFANIAFDSLYDTLVAQKADVVISGLRYEAERTRDVFYTMPYFDAGQVAIVRAADAAAKVQDLAGRVVAVETASEGDVEARKLATKLTGLVVHGYATLEDAVVALWEGKADAVVTDHVSALALVKGQADLRLLLPPFAPDPLVVAGRAGDRALMREINRIIKALQADGTLSLLAARAL